MLSGGKVVLVRPSSCSSKPVCYQSVVLLFLITWCQMFGNSSRRLSTYLHSLFTLVCGVLCLWSPTREIMGKDHDRPVFDISDPDRRRAFTYFDANFRNFCIMEDFINPAKDVDSDDYWIRAKRLKAMAALRRAFPPQESVWQSETFLNVWH